MGYRVIVDVSEAGTAALRAEGAFHRFPEQIYEVLADAADVERSTHKYKNRTGDLEAMTEVDVVVATDDVVSFTFGSSQDYASYVEEKGLSRITEFWEASQEEFDEIVHELGEYVTHG